MICKLRWKEILRPSESLDNSAGAVCKTHKIGTAMKLQYFVPEENTVACMMMGKGEWRDVPVVPESTPDDRL